jgi:hypothetical protein
MRMSRPGTHHFIGPLTEAQTRRRMRARYHYNDIAEAMDARGISFTEAIKAVKWEKDHRFSEPWQLELARMEMAQ